MDQQTDILNQLDDWYEYAENSMHVPMLSLAIRGMRPLAQTLEQWALLDQLNEYDLQLNLMMDYLRKGAEDPSRKEVYCQLERKLWSILYQLNGLIEIKRNCPYYDTLVKKWQKRHGAEELEHIISDLRNSHSYLEEPIAWTDAEEAKRQVELHSKRQRDLFYYHLTRFTWNREELSLMQQALKKGGLPDEELCVAISGITLSLLMCADAIKLDWLLSAYQYARSYSVQARALVGFIYAVNTVEYLTQRYPELVQRLLALGDNPRFETDIKQTILQMHCQQETKVTQKRLTDVIIPDLVKYGGTKLNDTEENEEEKLFEPNTDWKMEERMEKHFNELIKRTKRGEDIQYASFKHAKQHAFFHEMAHWFLPFNPLNKYIVELYGMPTKRKNIMFHIAESGFYCASDCYSFCMLFSKLPSALRGRLSETTLSEEIEQMNQAAEGDSFEKQMRLYLQDLYRFAQLFPAYKNLSHKLEIELPRELMPHVLKESTCNELYLQIANLHLAFKSYKSARLFYEEYFNMSNEVPSALVLQECGYCYQQLNDIPKAIEWLTKADITQPNDPWTLRHLAQCHERRLDFSQALVCYKQLESFDPDNTKLIEKIGILYEVLRCYEEALPYFYKLYYLQEDSLQARAHIALCLLLLKRYDESCNYYNRVLEKEGDNEEYLVYAGVAAALNGDISTCIRRLTEAYQIGEEIDFDEFYWSLRILLQDRDIDVCELDIICNFVLVNLSSYHEPEESME